MLIYFRLSLLTTVCILSTSVCGTVYDPVKETIILPKETEPPQVYAKSFIAYEKANVFLQVRCRSIAKASKESNNTVFIRWALHYVPCEVKPDDLKIRDVLSEPCKEGIQTEFIVSEIYPFPCTSAEWGRSKSSLPSERLSPATSYPTCKNGSLSPHHHTNSTYWGIVASTWQTGRYVFYVASWSMNDTTTAPTTPWWQLELNVRVKTPGGGYLPAPTQPLLPFWITMVVIYSIIALVWLMMCAKDWRGVVRLHWFITLAVSTGFCEAIFGLTVAYGVNKLGYPRVTWNVAATLAQTIQSTVIRLLLIVIAMGYGSMKANRFYRSLFSPLAFFGAFYFFAIIIPSVMSVVKPVYVKMVLYSKLPSVCVNIISVVWITISIFKTAKILKHHNDDQKLKVYKILIAVMAVCFAGSIVFSACRIYLGLSAKCPQWQLWWLDEAFWALIALIVMITVCILWRPSQTTLVWAYSSLLNNEEDETYSRRPERMSADSNL